ncbi:hypothetical protein DFJ77DRAFT_460522 [Powellomyces hirtus]|nr:hypothetical protein DFJ77DRAFT_460522 [Powellomyces hirtus]
MEEGDGSPQYGNKLLEESDFASQFEGLSARSDITSPTPPHESRPISSVSHLITSPTRLSPHNSYSQHSHTHSQQDQPHPLHQHHHHQPQSHSHTDLSHNPHQQPSPSHPPQQHSLTQQQNHASLSHENHGNDGVEVGYEADLSQLKSEPELDESDFMSRVTHAASLSNVHAVPSMVDMIDPGSVPSSAHSHHQPLLSQQSQQQQQQGHRHDAFSPYTTPVTHAGGDSSNSMNMLPTLPSRQPRSRAQTFHFGSHLSYNQPTTFPHPIYTYPPYSDRMSYNSLSPYDTLPPLATVPEHSIPAMAPSSTSQLSQQDQMFTLQPPQFSSEDRLIQIRQQHQHFSFQDQTDPSQTLGGGRRSPVSMGATRQRSSSDQISRPSPLLVDNNALHRRSSVMGYSGSGSMVTPTGTPTPESYDPQLMHSSGLMMNGSIGAMGDQMHASHMGYGSGYLNPAHLSHPHTRRRAPSAPLIPNSYFQTPAASPTGGSPHDSPVFHHHGMHHLPNDMHPQIMNPVDEDFKRRILQLKFEEREIAIDFLKEQAKQTGFSVLVRTSRPDYVVIICNCGRRVKQVDGERKRKRKRKTAMTGCEWHVILFRRNIPGSTAPRMWEYRASSKMEHNHPLVLNDE